ncbi:hypothetical protein STVIR_8683 [Streptomyces viridochromogenes Tue57]|uniref:Uncharacterized protein n=1 Tax=Streptomyces viridochromogenes Tue57 TaxID=1160705 RepID=L8P2B2_STRVR|nr:hypothetical protein STVIR_8683 [Streptomyces viridochromogenes Tue57]
MLQDPKTGRLLGGSVVTAVGRTHVRDPGPDA